MKQRVLTAVISLLVLLAVVLLVPPVVARIAFAAVILAGAWEWSAFLRVAGTGIKYLYVVLIAAVIVAVSFTPGLDVKSVLAASLLTWLAALIWCFFYPTAIPVAVRWLGGIVILVPLYLALVTIYAAAPEVLLFALVIVWVADSGAFFAGKLLGRVKLAPRISPNKTWEGVIGGLAAVTLLALACGLWAALDLAILIPFCLAVACISVVGDLTVSMFKRNVGIKDSGTFFPGHGGVLDRIDSVASAAPLFALGLGWLGYP